MSLRYDAPSRTYSKKAQAGTVVLWKAVQDFWPYTTFLGIYAERPTATGAPSCHGEGRAIDIGVSGPRGDPIADWLVAHANVLSVQVVIWEHRIWSVNYGYWRPYGCEMRGSAKDHHTTHIHVEHNWEGAIELTRPEIDAVRPGPTQPPPTEQEYPMTGIFHPDASAGGDTKALWLLDGGVYDAIPGGVLNEVQAVLANRKVEFKTVEISGPLHAYLKARYA